MNKKLFWVITIVILVLVIVGLVQGTGKPDAASDSIKVGMNLGLTGFGASWSENAVNGAKLAVKEINEKGGVLGKKLELIIEDNHTSSKDSVTVANKLIFTDKVPFMLVGWTDEVEPIIPLLNQNKIVAGNFSAGATGITKKSPYMFRTWPADRIAVRSLVTYVKEKGYKRIAMVQSIGNWENTLTASFKELATVEGLTVSDAVSFPVDTQDFKTIISKIRTEKPDAIFTPITSGAVERFMNQASDLGLNIPLLYPVDVTGIGVPAKVPVAYLKNIIYAIYANSRQDYIDAYVKEYGKNPEVSSDTAYDAVYVLANAIQKAGVIDPEKVIAAVEGIDGASGKIEFDEYRDRVDAEVLLMGFDGKSQTPIRIK